MSSSLQASRGQKEPVVTAIGLMSGTSLDGIDAAFLRTDGRTVQELGPETTIAYSNAERKILRRAVEVALSCRRRPDKPPAAISEADALVTEAHGRAVEKIMNSVPANKWSADVVGFHGQTILHRPDEGWTWQIGDGGALASRLGVAVVDDFRSADVAEGGQGAPLAPLYHQALVKSLEQPEPNPVAVVNIGGVANVTWVGTDDRLLAFDTGPGNGLLDDWMGLRCGKPSDLDGAAAARGQCIGAVLGVMMAHPYFKELPPKSLDRHDFNLEAVASLSTEDGAATLTRFTACTIAAARAYFPAPVSRWLVCGGGRHNPVLMAELSNAVGAPVMPVEDVGWRGDSLEAEAFGLLAVAAMRGMPLSFPATTGVRRPVTGGRIHHPDK